MAQAQAEVKRAESQLKLAQADRDRYAELGAQGVISQQQLDQAQTNADTAQANIDTVRATLEHRFSNREQSLIEREREVWEVWEVWQYCSDSATRSVEISL